MASDRIWTIPNVLSSLRLMLAIVLYVAIERGLPTAAFWLFIVAASTDWVDGWWARRFGQVSRLGRILDPLVDKVIVCGSYALLAGAGFLAFWEIPAPRKPIEKVLPNERFPR